MSRAPQSSDGRRQGTHVKNRLGLGNARVLNKKIGVVEGKGGHDDPHVRLMHVDKRPADIVGTTILSPKWVHRYSDQAVTRYRDSGLLVVHGDN